MFWGITLDSGKRYTQTVEKSFHLSMAALGFQNCSSTPVTVMVEVDKAQFAICTLQPGKISQQPLDYCFTEGEEITFFTEGPGDVHLTGYLIEEPNALEFEDEEELSADSEESESASVSSNSGSDDDSGSTSDEMTLGDLLHGNDTLGPNDNDDDDDSNDFDDGDWDPSKDNPKKKKKTKKGKKPKNLKEDSEESNEETEGAEGIFSNDLSDDEDEDESWSPEVKVKLKGKSEKKLGTKKKGKKRQLKADESMENDTTENETILPKKPKKKAKKSHSNMVESNNGLVNNNLSISHQDESSSSVNNSNETLSSPKKDSSENVQVKCEVEAQQSSTEKNDQPQSHKKRKLPGGTEVEDIKKGQGKMAKAGHQVSVYYKGNLTKNKKQFDACLSGTPFSFRLGAGKVIRGWDLGVAGMQVGGKRKLTVPPSQGYGSKKAGPIPPNSTLEFEIQLVKLN